jgi:hypothetical protein
MLRSPSLTRLHAVEALRGSSRRASHRRLLEALLENSASLAVLLRDDLEEIFGHFGSLVDHDLVGSAVGRARGEERRRGREEEVGKGRRAAPRSANGLMEPSNVEVSHSRNVDMHGVLSFPPSVRLDESRSDSLNLYARLSLLLDVLDEETLETKE